jgi:hypothetical protein
MRMVRLTIYFIALIAALTIGAYLLAVASSAQTIDPDLRPDTRRVLESKQPFGSAAARKGAYEPARTEQVGERRPRLTVSGSLPNHVARVSSDLNIPATTSIGPGTRLSRVLHTSQLSLSSSAGTDEQFVDRTGDLVADERTTFDSIGGSFDIAVGKSGARYEVYSATLNNTLVGVLVVALDTNGDYVVNSSSTFNLQRDFGLPSAAAVVSGTSKAGQEFVIVSSSGYFNSADPNDPNNEPSPGIVLLVRDPNTGGFDNSRSRELVRVGNNQLFNANALALMPNNDLLIADFRSDELRIIRDSDGDGMPDTLDNVAYYSYPFSDDSPLDIAVNSRGVVFSHSAGNDTVMLAIYDDNADGRGDRDEVVVEGLSIDNNLFLHGMAVDRKGSVYVIEDASASFDGASGNGGTARIDAFPDPNQDGFLQNGKIFTQADSGSLGLSGLGFGPTQFNDSQFFVRQQYLDFLNRDADGSGLLFWMNNIDLCGLNAQCRDVKRIDTSAAFFLSIEFQRTGFLVYRVYKTSFPERPERPRALPRLQEFIQDTQTIGSGLVVGEVGWQQKLEANTVAFLNSFVARAEFQTNFPAQLTAAQYVDKLNTMTGGALSQAERDALVNGLSGGQETRATVLRKVAEDGDFSAAEFNRAFVLMQYFGYLRRNPNDAPDSGFAGFDFWLGKLNEFGGDFRRAEMVKAFINSTEYRDRFD